MRTFMRKYEPLRDEDAQAVDNWKKRFGAKAVLFRSLLALLIISISLNGLSFYQLSQSSSPSDCVSDFGAFP